MKKFIGIAAGALALLLLTGCNRQVIDLTYKYDKAVIAMPDGSVVQGTVESWNDYGGEQLQIKIDGVTYLTHAENVVMMAGDTE